MEAIVNALKNLQLHPVIDHFTVAIVIVAVLADLIASLFYSRMWIRYMALTLIILGALVAFGSNVTGGWEGGRVWHQLSGPAKELLHKHAELGDWLPWIIGALAVWRLGLQFFGFLAGTRPIYLMVAVVGMALVLYQGYLGGKLVYTYGVGTAVMPVAESSPAPAGLVAPPTGATPVPTVFVPTETPTAAVPSASETPNAPATAAPSPSASVEPEASTTPSSSGAATSTPTDTPSESPTAASTPSAVPSAKL